MIFDTVCDCELTWSYATAEWSVATAAKQTQDSSAVLDTIEMSFSTREACAMAQVTCHAKTFGRGREPGRPGLASCFGCSLAQPVPEVPALFSPAKNTMQLFMWQHDIVGVAHFIMGCFDVLGALSDAPDDASTSSSSALTAG